MSNAVQTKMEHDFEDLRARAGHEFNVRFRSHKMKVCLYVTALMMYTFLILIGMDAIPVPLLFVMIVSLIVGVVVLLAWQAIASY